MVLGARACERQNDRASLVGSQANLGELQLALCLVEEGHYAVECDPLAGFLLGTLRHAGKSPRPDAAGDKLHHLRSVIASNELDAIRLGVPVELQAVVGVFLVDLFREVAHYRQIFREAVAKKRSGLGENLDIAAVTVECVFPADQNLVHKFLRWAKAPAEGLLTSEIPNVNSLRHIGYFESRKRPKSSKVRKY